MTTMANIPRQQLQRSIDESEDANERARFLVKCLADEAYSGKFTDWEDEFIESLYDKLLANPKAVFSDKQLEILERIWKK